MPDAPASSLPKAVVQAASGTWRPEPGVLFVVPEPELSDDEPAVDGRPENPANRSMGVGDLREAAWFTPFDNRGIRDSRRGFRR